MSAQSYRSMMTIPYPWADVDRPSPCSSTDPGSLCVCSCTVHAQVWEERDREFVAAGDLTMDEDCLILLIDADTKVG